MNKCLHSVGSYQISATPFVTGSLTIPNNSSEPLKISFPFVTKWFIVTNTSNSDIRLGFSVNGIKNNNYFIINDINHSAPNNVYDLKVSEIYLLSNTNSSKSGIYVMAGLTSIATCEICNNWSGSIGIG